MSGALERAALVPFTIARDAQSHAERRSYGEEIWLDFNPETLSIHYPSGVSSSTKEGPGRTQSSTPTAPKLTFTALFDTTRPLALGAAGVSMSSSIGASGGLDVRERTRPLLALIGQAPGAPRSGSLYVQFRWGAILFSGTLGAFDEKLTLFSADGTPLRSQLEVNISGDTSLGAEPPQDRVAWSKEKRIGSQPGLGLAPGQGLGLSPGLNLGFGAGAGLSLSAGAAVGVFGGVSVRAAFGASVGLDLSLSVSGLPSPRPGAGDAPGSTPSSWAPAGPAAGSAAAAEAALVAKARAQGASVLGIEPTRAALLQTSSAPPSPASGAGSPGSAAAAAAGAANDRAGARAALPTQSAFMPSPMPIQGAPPTRSNAPAPPSQLYSRAPSACNEPTRESGRPSWEPPMSTRRRSW